MLNFDKLQLVLRYSPHKRPFIVMDARAFTISPLGNHTYYDEKTDLSIEYNKIPRFGNNGQKELKIKLTSKILGVHMCDLINRDNIMQCFKNLNKRKIINISISEKLLDDFEVVLADVTMDKKADSTFMKQFEDYSMTNFINHKKNTIILPRYPQFNTIIHNTAKVSRHKKRLTIYDKSAEIHHMQRFQNIPNSVVAHFKDIYRIERNLTTEEQIRNALNIQSQKVTLRDVLNADAQPFLDMYKEFVTMGTKPIEFTTMKAENIKNFCLVRRYDVVKVEHALRRFYKSSYSKKVFEPYKQVCYEHLLKGSTQDYTLRKKIRDFLKVSLK